MFFAIISILFILLITIILEGFNLISGFVYYIKTKL